MFKLRHRACALNKAAYEEEKYAFNCQSSVKVYHCIQDDMKRLGEICIQYVWVKPNYCPEYNTDASSLDLVPCNGTIGSCPKEQFLSYDVYKYPVCLNTTIPYNETVSRENVASLAWIIVASAVSILILLLIVFCVPYRIQRKKQNRNEDTENAPFLPINELKEPYYESTAFQEGKEFILNGGRLVCLVGQWGSGKTSTAKQVFMSITKEHPKVIQNYLTFKAGDQPVIFDDAISTDIEIGQLREKLKKSFENMSCSVTNAFIIITLNEKMENLIRDFVKSLFPNEDDIKFINLSKTLMEEDRTKILRSQFEMYSRDKDFSTVKELALTGKYHSLGYPEICALFSRCSAFQKVGSRAFCKRPLHHLKRHLEKMHRSKDNKMFLMLVYMSLNHMEIDINTNNDMLFELLRSCRCRTSTSDSNKNDMVTLLSKELVIKEADPSIYRLQHDVIKRMTLIVFGTYHFDELLKFSKEEDLIGWIEEKDTSFSKCELNSDTRPVLEINGERWKQYNAKLSGTAI